MKVGQRMAMHAPFGGKCMRFPIAAFAAIAMEESPMRDDRMLNVLQGMVLFRCVTTSIVAKTWFAQSSSAISMYEMARQMIRAMVRQRVAIIHGRHNRESVVIATSEGRRMASVETRQIGRASVGSNGRLLFDAHTVSVAEVLGRLSQQISLIPFMRFICACETPIVAGDQGGGKRSDAVVGIVSMPTDAVASHGVFRPVAWTTWDDVQAVITHNLRGNIEEIAGYYAIEVDRGAVSLSSFRERARIYRQGREEPPSASMPVAPIPLVITTTPQRAESIVRVWSESDPDTIIFAIDWESFFRYDVFTRAWFAYRGRSVRSPYDRLSPFGALRTRKVKIAPA